MSIEGLNLADRNIVTALQDALPRNGRAALETYALPRWPKSTFHHGEQIGGTRTLAAKIG